MSSERGLLVFQAQRVERDGGMARLLFGGVFMAVATLVFDACALCAALWRHEAHRRFAIVLLVGSCLFLWVFGRPTFRFAQNLLSQNAGAASLPIQARRPASGVVSSVRIPDSLLRHFQDRGIVLRPARDGDGETEWIVDNAASRCFIRTAAIRHRT